MMPITDALNPLIQWLNHHPHWAVLVTFIISTLESIAIIGTIVPGTIMMTAVGALAGADVIPFWPTLISAILGAIAGDGVSYLLGYHFKNRIRQIWPFSKNPKWLDKGESFFHKHGGKSVFIGRFVGPVRAIIPLIAGMLGMKPLRFYFANIVSAIGWAPIYMLPGILLGAASLELPPDIAVHVMLMILLVILLIMFCIWLVFKIFSMIGDKIEQLLNQFWFKLQSSRYAKIIAAALKHHNKNKTHGQLVLAFYLLAAILGFAYLAYIVTQHNSSTLFINDLVFHFFRGLRSPLGDNIMLGITLLGDKYVLIPAIIIISTWLFLTKRTYLAWHVLALVLLTIISIEFFKPFIHSARPWGLQVSPENYSFPSGHTTLTTTFFIGFALLLSRLYPSQRRFLFYSAIIIAVTVSISRLYLGAHWFTDICAGWLLSAALLLLISISYHRKSDPQPQLSGLISVSLIAIITMYTLIFFHSFNHLKQNYTMIDYPTYTLNMSQWQQQTDQHIPLVRTGRFGIEEQNFNLQWIADINSIKNILLKNNWEAPPVRNWISILQRIADVESAAHLPLVSPLYLDKEPALVLIKHTDSKKRVIVLRLWDTNILITPTQQHLWVGTISIIPRTYNWIFRKKPYVIDITPQLLFEKIPKNMHIQTTKNQPDILLINSK